MYMYVYFVLIIAFNILYLFMPGSRPVHSDVQSPDKERIGPDDRLRNITTHTDRHLAAGGSQKLC